MTGFVSRFQQRFTLEKRIAQRNTIAERHPRMIPVIVETRDADIKLRKFKFLVPGDITVGQLAAFVRKQVIISDASGQSLFISLNGGTHLPVLTNLMSVEYKRWVDPDGFLYVVIECENTFGSFRKKT